MTFAQAVGFGVWAPTAVLPVIVSSPSGTAMAIGSEHVSPRGTQSASHPSLLGVFPSSRSSPTSSMSLPQVGSIIEPVLAAREAEAPDEEEASAVEVEVIDVDVVAVADDPVDVGPVDAEKAHPEPPAHVATTASGVHPECEARR